MTGMQNLIKRNLWVFFRDRSAVFFSFLSVIIIIGLYALFLADTQVKSLKSMVGDVDDIRFLVDSWIMGGLLAVNTVTVSLGALAVMVRDQETKAMRDFMTAPIRRMTIVFSYIISAFIIGVVITVVGFFVMEVYIMLAGGQMLSIGAMAKTIGVLLLCVINSTAMLFFITSFVRSSTAFSTVSTIMGTMIGFLAGIYVPIGVLPQGVQYIIEIFPTSHGAVLLRQLFMEVPLARVFENAPAAALDEYNKVFGVEFYVGGEPLSDQMMILYLSVVTVVFILLSIWRVRKMKTN
jgi:multidrug/hemolysin transport system permease protein